VSPVELEDHLIRHPFVRDAGVVGRPDERAGEVPVAFVALTQIGHLEAQNDVARVVEEIKDHVRSSKVSVP
jgi:acyl-coenzyme A synthetase/AMP-(fatty) acid ligase